MKEDKIKKYVVCSHHPNFSDPSMRNREEIVRAYNAYDAYWQVALILKEQNFTKPYVTEVRPFVEKDI